MMVMVKQILMGVLIACIGGTIVYFSHQLREMFGVVSWAESNLSGTRNMYILFGFVMIVIGFLILFGVVSLGSPMDTI